MTVPFFAVKAVPTHSVQAGSRVHVRNEVRRRASAAS